MPEIPFVQRQNIRKFDTATDSVYGAVGALNKNVMVELDHDKQKFVLTQRPGIWLLTDGSASGLTQGRGMYSPVFGNFPTIFVNGVNVYATSAYTSALTGTLQTSAGTPQHLPVFFEFLDDKIIINDPSQSSGKPLYSVSSPYTTLEQLTDIDIPVQTANGIAQLNGYMFVMDRGGNIKNSDLDDPTSWPALGTIQANRTLGSFASFIGRHHDNIVAFKDDSIEFFYTATDSGSAASPLRRRQDVFYEIGAHKSSNSGGYTVVKIGEKLFFVGVDIHKSYGVYVLDRFNLTKISDHFLDQILKRWQSSVIIGGTISYMGRDFYILTDFSGASNEVQESVVIDTETGYMAQWDTNISGITPRAFPVLGGQIVGIAASSDFGIASATMMINGDIIALSDNFVGKDKALNLSDVDIDIEIRTPIEDNGTSRPKFCRSLELVGYSESAVGAPSISVQYSDDNQNTYNTARQIALDPSGYQRLAALGRYSKRSWKFTAALNERVWLYGANTEVTL